LLLITTKLQTNQSGGRELLSFLNFSSLKEIYGRELKLFELEKPSKSIFLRGFDILRGHIDGASSHRILDVLNLIKKENIKSVFIDGSNLGAFVKAIKKNYPDVRITTFFHNCEARFFFGALNSNFSIHALGVLAANYIAEYKSVKYSNYRIALSQRDSDQLIKIYKIGATHISSMSMIDKFTKSEIIHTSFSSPETKFALFVGGNFYANRDGITWFIKNVAPKINMNIVIIGRGLEGLKNQFSGINNVQIIGEVSSVNEWYLKSQFVIAPIFDGSGMKTKVAEALMFGRKVIGSPEAFSGYEKFINDAGWICKSSKDFIIAINHANQIITSPFHPELREIFKKHFSQNSLTLRLEKILQ